GVTGVVEPVVRRAAGGEELPDAGLVPVGDRARLPEPMARVEAELRRRRAGGALLAADAGDPAVQPRQRPGERLDLADAAARVRVALPQAVAVQRRLPAERRALEALDDDSVARLDLPPHRVGLRE